MKDSFKNRFSKIFGKDTTSMISFKERTINFWSEFEKEEANIRQLMLDKVDGNTLVAAMSKILETAFKDIPFEMGINDEDKHELILSPNGNRILLMQILYSLKYKPEHLDDKWNFYSTKPAQGKEGMELNIYDTKMTADDFLIYTDLDKERKIINIEVYVPTLDNLSEGHRYNALFIMLDLFIGELYTMEYIGKIDILEIKKSDEHEHIPLTKMKAYIDYLVNEHDWEKTKNIVESYSAYKVEGDENAKKLRDDAYIGYTSCFEIIRDLKQDDIYPIKQFEEDGVYLAYIYYDNSTVPQESMVPQRAEIEDLIADTIKEQGIADCIGGATGYNNSYIDFMIFDLAKFIEVSERIMRGYNFKTKGLGYFQSSEKNINFK